MNLRHLQAPAGELDEQCPMSSSRATRCRLRAVLGHRGPRRGQLRREPFRFDFGVDRYRWVGRGRPDRPQARGGSARSCTFWVPVAAGLRVAADAAQPPRQGDGDDRRRGRSRASSCSTTSTAARTRCGARWGCSRSSTTSGSTGSSSTTTGATRAATRGAAGPGNGFAAAHHFVDGVSTARADAAHGDAAHRPRHDHAACELSLGDAARSSSTSSDRSTGRSTPCGTVVDHEPGQADRARAGTTPSTSRSTGRPSPTTRPAHRSLFGRYPSFQRLMADARIEDEHLVFPERR